MFVFKWNTSYIVNCKLTFHYLGVSHSSTVFCWSICLNTLKILSTVMLNQFFLFSPKPGFIGAMQHMLQRPLKLLIQNFKKWSLKEFWSLWIFLYGCWQRSFDPSPLLSSAKPKRNVIWLLLIFFLVKIVSKKIE
jgi:hypothetical protein